MSLIETNIVAFGHGSLNPSYFCVHSTANVGATAYNHVNYWRNNPMYAVHLVSDWNRAVNTVPYTKLCYQVGNGNKYVEGIEICEAANSDDFWKGIEIAAEVCAERLAAHGWGIDRLISHNECRLRWGGTDHTDPDPYFKRWGYSWSEFKNLVQEKLEGDIVKESDIQAIAERVWQVSEGRYTADRVYRSTSILKAMCGMGAEDMTDPKSIADSIHDWTIGRIERMLLILKGMVGIEQEDMGDDAIKTPMHVSLSDEDMEKLADMVAKRING